MQTNLLGRTLALFVCVAMLALIGCGGGSSPSGGGETTYTLGGTLAGLGAAQSVRLEDNGGDTLTLSANGAFSFPMSLDTGSTYAITVQSHTPGIACTVSNGSGTVSSANVTGIDVSCASGTETILYSFGASATDGQNPAAGLIVDSAGNLYGTTIAGGANIDETAGKGEDDGAVFKISPGAAGTYTETILYSFGASPEAGLIMDSDGNLYGTTRDGGANGKGTVFKISAAGTETILYSFGASATDGQNPEAGLIMDSDGNLYGTTRDGGANGVGTGGDGTVFVID
ncbi:MAG: choice-of-anchor tandem repeat GloVer-containing protein [Terracidiphilus sp.]